MHSGDNRVEEPDDGISHKSAKLLASRVGASTAEAFPYGSACKFNPWTTRTRAIALFRMDHVDIGLELEIETARRIFCNYESVDNEIVWICST